MKKFLKVMMMTAVQAHQRWQRLLILKLREET